MEAYDAAVLSYALATQATKIKPPATLLGGRTAAAAAPTLDNSESLTPPPSARRLDGNLQDTDNYLYQLLLSLEQQLVNKTPITLNQLMEICATKQQQNDQHVIVHLECLHGELKQICKTHPQLQAQQFLMKIDGDSDDDNSNNHGVSLKTQTVCKSLSELLKQFRLLIGSNIIRKLFGN